MPLAFAQKRQQSDAPTAQERGLLGRRALEKRGGHGTEIRGAYPNGNVALIIISGRWQKRQCPVTNGW